MGCIVKNYRDAVGAGAEKVYKKIVELKCQHTGGVSKWSDLISKKKTTCNISASLSLQQAGCLSAGSLVGHVPTKGKKESNIKNISQAMYGREKLKHCRVIWVDCTYPKLPKWLKRKGVVYVMWSNSCVNAGNGWIWSCNQEGGYSGGRYVKYKDGVLANHGTYPFSGRIFVVILPDDKWRQHYAVEAVLGMHGNGDERRERFGSEYDEIQKMVTKMMNNPAYLYRWAADYTFELYAGNGEDRRKFFGKYYDQVQKKVTDIYNWAKKGITDRKIVGDDYEQVIREIDRLKK